jgi:hypothetical protein
MSGSNFIINYGVIMSAKAKVLSYLSKDGDYNTLTATKMQSVFGIKNPSAVVNELRSEGHAIYRNTRTLATGEKVSYYRLGTPTKRMVAAGIIALRQHGVSTFA